MYGENYCAGSFVTNCGHFQMGLYMSPYCHVPIFTVSMTPQLNYLLQQFFTWRPICSSHVFKQNTKWQTAQKCLKSPQINQMKIKNKTTISHSYSSYKNKMKENIKIYL